MKKFLFLVCFTVCAGTVVMAQDGKAAKKKSVLKSSENKRKAASLQRLEEKKKKDAESVQNNAVVAPQAKSETAVGQRQQN
ncbi:MAG: hypothetical protein QM687_15115 [Ferruginibacter sp.]